MGQDGQFRDSQGRILDLRDSGDFGKGNSFGPNQHKKTPHLSNQEILNRHKKRAKKGLKNNLPVK